MVFYCFSKDSGEAWTLDFVGRHSTFVGSGIFVIDPFIDFEQILGGFGMYFGRFFE